MSSEHKLRRSTKRVDEVHSRTQLLGTTSPHRSIAPSVPPQRTRTRRHSEQGPAPAFVNTDGALFGSHKAAHRTREDASSAPRRRDTAHNVQLPTPQRRPTERRVRFPEYRDSVSSSGTASSASDPWARGYEARGYDDQRRDKGRERERDSAQRKHYYPAPGSEMKGAPAQPPPQEPRRRATSLLKFFTQGSMTMFEINPRWAKRRPLL